MNISPRTLIAAAAVAALLLPVGAAGQTSQAANKTSAAGSTIQFLGPQAADGSAVDTTATLLTTSIKTSPPTDLIFSVTLECALWTVVKTVGNDEATSTARVVVWVEFDGHPVPISSADTGADAGKVVFCDRTHQQQTTGFDDENATIRQYLATRTANAFNWVLPDVGGGSVPHTVVLKAELSGDTVGMATSQAGIGHRTMIVEPTHMAEGATVDSGTTDGGSAAPAASQQAVAAPDPEPAQSPLQALLAELGF